ncbi:endonuclease/exonuclease/phosphatase family protein [Nocardioides sp. GCM10027113]|uniref:endonuclease/exonuclease/phosphatase family protein n=1 Tax=unclassified Nocardioides TaxID=2615069 RepID=UPI003606A1AC
MSTTRLARPTRRGRATVLTSLAAAAGLALGALGAVPAAQAAQEQPASDVTMVQANIKSDLSVEKFQSDVRTVLAQGPDVVTYNEVPLRKDEILAPAGYGLHRKTKNRYTAATAVAWREDRWAPVAQGTYRISNYREKPPGRSIMIGLRFANWVTLESPDGRRMSVVAVHIAPLDRNMPDLLKGSVRRLRGLVDQLAPAGPVLVGGDFNVHYKSGRYPRTMFDNAFMAPTYDSLGTYFPTGDHGGYTIDYVFGRGSEILRAVQHSPVELYSDHDAVVSGFSWQVDAPADTQRIANDPAGDTAAQRLALSTVVEQLRSAEAGGRVELATMQLDVRAAYKQLRRAAARGVEVQLTTRSVELTARERRLGRFFAEIGDPDSWVRQCIDQCRVAWRDNALPRTLGVVRDAQGAATVRVDVDRPLDQGLVERQTEVVLRTGEHGMAEGAEKLASLG